MLDFENNEDIVAEENIEATDVKNAEINDEVYVKNCTEANDETDIGENPKTNNEIENHEIDDEGNDETKVCVDGEADSSEDNYDSEFKSPEEIKAAIESILFTMGEAVESSRIAEALQITNKMAIRLLRELMEKYNNDNSGINIIELDKSYQMCSNPKYYESLIKLCHVPKKHNLTDVMLETLAIVAYKQPVTRQEIEAIRGVKSDFAVNKLIEYNLICELGRKDVPGRPILFGTTEDFLRCFGVSNAAELPAIDEEKKAEFLREALDESKNSEEIVMDNL
jgi:segregation and condensation protein B